MNAKTRAGAAVAMAIGATFIMGGIASAAGVGDQVTGTGWNAKEGSAYAIALTNARNQCPNRNDVSLVSRSTWPQNGGYSASITLRCN